MWEKVGEREVVGWWTRWFRDNIYGVRELQTRYHDQPVIADCLGGVNLNHRPQIASMIKIEHT